jgi:thiol-disulfide isomerase/thioredoxin
MALGRRQWLALGGVSAAAAAAGALVGALGLQSSSGATALLAYPFEYLDGRSTRLRDWSNPILLCNFWATWCAPCREEIPRLIAARQQHAVNGLEIAGIGVDNADNLRGFVKEYGIHYPVLLAKGDVAALIGALGDTAAALPYSVLLDRARRVAYRKLGAWSNAELEREIRAAIG